MVRAINLVWRGLRFGARDEVWAEVWLLRPEVEVWGLRLGFLRCELEVGVLRFEAEVWG